VLARVAAAVVEAVVAVPLAPQAAVVVAAAQAADYRRKLPRQDRATGSGRRRAGSDI